MQVEYLWADRDALEMRKVLVDGFRREMSEGSRFAGVLSVYDLFDICERGRDEIVFPPRLLVLCVSLEEDDSTDFGVRRAVEGESVEEMGSEV